MDFINSLKQQFEVREDEPLSLHTTWRVGGPASYFVESNSKEDIIKLVAIARKFNIDFAVIGQGANILASDAGFKGLVIKNRTSEIEVKEEIGPLKFKEINARRSESQKGNNFISVKDIDYDEKDLPRQLINAESGCLISLLFHESVKNSLTGLQWFAGIPASVGGAVYNNIHGGTHFISDIVYDVEYLNTKGEIKHIKNEELNFEYDYSEFHGRKDVILSVNFALFKGDVEKAKSTWNEWALRKKEQPRNSAGSTWQNLSEKDMLTYKLQSASAGFIIDQILHLKGIRYGKAFVSINGNANFIETEEGAKAQDVLNVMKRTREDAAEKIGILLKPEIFFLGFDKNPLYE